MSEGSGGRVCTFQLVYYGVQLQNVRTNLVCETSRKVQEGLLTREGKGKITLYWCQFVPGPCFGGILNPY